MRMKYERPYHVRMMEIEGTEWALKSPRNRMHGKKNITQ